MRFIVTGLKGPTRDQDNMRLAGVWLFLHWTVSSAEAEVIALPLEFGYSEKGLRIFIRKKECKTGQPKTKGARKGIFLGLSPKPVIPHPGYI